MEMRVLLAVAAVLSAGAAMARPVQSYDTYRSWLVACDNVLSCVAKGFDDGGGTRAEVRVSRAAGPAAVATLTIRSEAPFARGDLRVDGRPLALDPAQWRLVTDADGTTLTGDRPAAVRALATRLADGQRLTLGGGDAFVPLAGLTAALLRIDDRQGRVGGTTALVRPGAASAARVPVAGPLPFVPARAIRATLAAGEGARLIARTRAAQRQTLRAEDCEDPPGPIPPEAHALDARRALVLLPCLMGAYQGSSLAFVVPRGGGPARRLILPTPYRGASREAATADLFTEAGFDPATGMLAMAAKGRGLADCGMTASWIWDGAAFRLAEMTLQDRCGGTEPGDWPYLFRSRQ